MTSFYSVHYLFLGGIFCAIPGNIFPFDVYSELLPEYNTEHIEILEKCEHS